MLFTDSLFLFYFLPFALIALRLATAGSTGRSYPAGARIALFALTCLFYGFREPWWLLPFGLCIGFDFLWASLLARSERAGWRKFWLACSLLQNLSLLGLFKYWDFILFNIARWAPHLAASLPRLSHHGQPLPLPPGISFYTFESLSFVIDVYRREILPPKKASEFFAFIGMFPRFIAGPIVRYRDMTGQFQKFAGMQVERGLIVFIWGLFLKSLFADQFEMFVGYAFASDAHLDFWSAWVGVLCYTMQIYFDFAGYSLMAIGLGIALGFEFPANFNRPYLAVSLQDFWRRWHISLSTWLRDYLYISMGGSRRGTARTYLHLFLTMLIGGLWHGARWTFILWGAWHGLWLCLERALGLSQRLPRWLGQVTTFLVVMTGWILFRVNTGPWEALKILRAMLTPWAAQAAFSWEPLVQSPLSVACCLGGLFYCFFLDARIDVLTWTPQRMRAGTTRVLSALMLLGALLLAFSSRAIPFLYFQF